MEGAIKTNMRMQSVDWSKVEPHLVPEIQRHLPRPPPLQMRDKWGKDIRLHTMYNSWSAATASAAVTATATAVATATATTTTTTTAVTAAAITEDASAAAGAASAATHITDDGCTLDAHYTLNAHYTCRCCRMCSMGGAPNRNYEWHHNIKVHFESNTS